MDVYDVIMLTVLVAATLFGAWKGLVWQLASLGAIVVSYFVAYRFRGPVAEMINMEEPWNRFTAMLVLYLATSLGIWIAFRFVSEFIDKLRLKEFDRQVGALFGFAKGAILCTIITLFALALSQEVWRERIIHSRSGFYIAKLLDKSEGIMPEEIHEVLQPYLHTLDESLGDEAIPRTFPGQAAGQDPNSDEIRENVRDLFRFGQRVGETTRQ